MGPTLSRRVSLAFASSVLVLLVGASSALLGISCGPFSDTAADTFCPFVLEIFYLGTTTGTTATTFDPTGNVTRLQMATFLSRSVDGVLRRGSRRAALDQFWTTQNATVLGLTTVGSNPRLLKADDVNIWVANNSGNSVSRVRAGDGKLLETWTGAVGANGVLVAMGRIFVTSETIPGNLYRIDPAEAAGAVTTVASNLGVSPFGITFDGARVWTANVGPPGSVSIVTPEATIPWTVTTVTTGLMTPTGALYDGAYVWVTDSTAGALLKLDSTGAILQTVTVGGVPEQPAFDGTNIWVPSVAPGLGSVCVVRSSSGVVLQTLTGNGLNAPLAAAFDGQRVLVTSFNGNSVSLWKAADLTPLEFSATGSGTAPYGACSDGVNFWIALNSAGKLARF